jgi:DNA-binding HxlR family transcriptional regulator
MAVLTMTAASTGELRFSELKRLMRGISQKMLTQTLRSLERDGMVTRRVQPTTPPQVHYGLTERGLSLAEPLGILREWAETHMPEVHASDRTWDARPT